MAGKKIKDSSSCHCEKPVIRRRSNLLFVIPAYAGIHYVLLPKINNKKANKFKTVDFFLILCYYIKSVLLVF